MKSLVSYRELDDLGALLIADYRSRTGRRGADSVDIDGFIRDYLGLRIEYRQFATGDPDDLGFCGDGSSTLWIIEDGKRTEWTCPDGTVVIERSLLAENENGRRRFTLAHEAAHRILMRHVPLQAVSCFLMPQESEVRGKAEDLERVRDLNEACTNRLAAALLMPEALVRRAAERYAEGRCISCYGRGVLTQEEKLAIGRMADMLKVSYSALLYRLGELGMTRYRPFREYAEQSLGVRAI